MPDIRSRTQVVIVGAGPAGMFLAHLLRRHDIDAVVLENRSRAYVQGRVRAGVLEQGTAGLMEKLGIGARLRREGLVHAGINLAADDEHFRIDLAALTGRNVIVYGQQEVMKDLFDAADADGLSVRFEAVNVTLHDVATDRPFVTYEEDGSAFRVDCDYIAGCDGSHGVSAKAIPASLRRDFERIYPFGWLGILADVAPANHELIYSNHERGFALASMRSPTRSRYYVQCAIDERIEDWPDERFWDEVCLRLGSAGANVIRGPSFEKSIAPLRSAVTEPMRYGRLFLAGDAAHVVPPAGAKGMNLAVSDVAMLADGLIAYYGGKSSAELESYSDRALARVWKAQRFSWWFTGLTHRFPGTDGFDRRIQMSELAYIRNSRAAQTALAENYVGLSWQ